MMKGKGIFMFELLVVIFALTAMHNNFVMPQSNTGIHKENGKVTTTGAWISDHIEEIQGLKMGHFVVRLDDGSVLTVEDTKSLISTDEGKT